eukprot:CAMPEP_0174738586 /NCGR_PEP_ID=MMETSP1094-20130205/70219_1 /TAXON_ID=156173 /ORGANISM="Chrysochromulina brevifilum, Strain UTEX LB 985" /LENGTH=236 /DNA_ID=CAMNT_0015942031 /DNA_START=12 /DNA_END=722 /DNA_ORIENTATION=+
MADEAKRRQVYVRCNGRPLQTTAAEIIDFFAEVGKPVEVLNKWGEPREGSDVIQQVAYATFKKNKAVEKALKLTGSTLSGRQVVVGINTRAPQPKGVATGSARVFVGNLAFDVSETAIRAHFAACGRILFVRWALEADGRTKGFCHVIFEDPPQALGSATRAALALDGSEIDGRPIIVGAAEQKPKPKRASKRPAPDADAAAEKPKAPRPAEWRHDRAAGLTLPRNKQSEAWGGTE